MTRLFFLISLLVCTICAAGQNAIPIWNGKAWGWYLTYSHADLLQSVLQLEIESLAAQLGALSTETQEGPTAQPPDFSALKSLLQEGQAADEAAAILVANRATDLLQDRLGCMHVD